MDNNIPKNFNIEVEIIPKYSTEEMKAAMKKSNRTTDDVICGIRKAVFKYQIKVDYEAFIESLEDFMTEYYGFIVTAVSESDQSLYDYSFSADDKKNNEICHIFRLNLRISENKESMFQSKGKCDELIKDITIDVFYDSTDADKIVKDESDISELNLFETNVFLFMCILFKTHLFGTDNKKI